MNKTVLCLTFTVGLIFPFSVFAQHLDEKTDCFPVHPKVKQLESWFSKIRLKLTAESNDKQDADVLLNGLGKKREVTCSLYVKTNGDIQNLKILNTSGLTRIDRAAVKLIRNASPFETPPNDLPTRAGISITLIKVNEGLKYEIRPHYLPGMLHVAVRD